MIDHEDADNAFTAAASSDGGGGWIGAIVSILLIVFLVWVTLAADENDKKCAAMKCEHGTPILAKHECLCVEGTAKP